MAQHYVGLDVSFDLVHICVVDEEGDPVWRGKCAVCPATIARHLREHAPGLIRVGLETGQFAPWLTLQLRRRKIATVCISARARFARGLTRPPRRTQGAWDAVLLRKPALTSGLFGIPACNGAAIRERGASEKARRPAARRARGNGMVAGVGGAVAVATEPTVADLQLTALLVGRFP